MGDPSPQSASPVGPDVSDDHGEPTRDMERTLSIPVPTREEWEATLARIGKRSTGVTHG
jgi:hypothetical protein